MSNERSNERTNETSDKTSNNTPDSEPNKDFVATIEYPNPFADYVLKLCQSAARSICIQSPRLDYEVFDNGELVSMLNRLVRESRQAQIRILVNDSRSIVSRGHQLLQLARRLPSTVHIQKLTDHANWNDETVVIRDTNGVLYKPGGTGHDAFYEPDSRASTRRHLELFEELWRYSVPDNELRSLSL